MKKTVASRIIRGLKEFSEALQNDESIADKFTCRKVTLALTTKAHDASSVKATRDLLKASQGVFAEFLGVRVSTLQSWEQGRQSPPESLVDSWTKYVRIRVTGVSGWEPWCGRRMPGKNLACAQGVSSNSRRSGVILGDRPFPFRALAATSHALIGRTIRTRSGVMSLHVRWWVAVIAVSALSVGTLWAQQRPIPGQPNQPNRTQPRGPGNQGQGQAQGQGQNRNNQNNQPEEVRLDDQRLIELHKQFIDNVEKLATEYEKKGELEKARHCYEQVLRLIPQYTTAKEKLDGVKTREASAERKVIDVFANKEWQDSGITIGEGKPVTIKAAGTWKIRIDYDLCRRRGDSQGTARLQPRRLGRHDRDRSQQQRPQGQSCVPGRFELFVHCQADRPFVSADVRRRSQGQSRQVERRDHRLVREEGRRGYVSGVRLNGFR